MNDQAIRLTPPRQRRKARRPKAAGPLTAGRASAKRQAKGKKLKAFAFTLPESIQQAFLDVPVLRHRIVAEKRLVVLCILRELQGQSLSLNSLAKAIGVSPGSILKWKDSFAADGIEGLIPKLHNCGRKRATGEKPENESCRLFIPIK